MAIRRENIAASDGPDLDVVEKVCRCGQVVDRPNVDQLGYDRPKALNAVRVDVPPVPTVAPDAAPATDTRRPVADGACQIANRLPQVRAGADVTAGSGVAGSMICAPSPGATVGAVVTGSTGVVVTVGIGYGWGLLGSDGVGPGVKVTLTTPVGTAVIWVGAGVGQCGAVGIGSGDVVGTGAFDAP